MFMGSDFIALFFLLKNINRKKENKMKNFIKALLLSLLVAASAVTAGCGGEGGNGTVTTADTTASVTTDAENSENPSNETKSEGGTEQGTAPKEENANSLWTNAKYTEDSEIGEGAVTLKVKVVVDNKEITLTVHTDKENLGAALLEYELVSGDESEYGLYIKSVNGIEADYDKDQAWWAISKDGEMLMTGADSTPIADGENYELTYTKG